MSLPHFVEQFFGKSKGVGGSVCVGFLRCRQEQTFDQVGVFFMVYALYLDSTTYVLGSILNYGGIENPKPWALGILEFSLVESSHAPMLGLHEGSLGA